MMRATTAVLVGLVLAPGPARGEDVDSGGQQNLHIQAATVQAGARIRWETRVPLESLERPDRRELVLRFSDPIDARKADQKLMDVLPGWVSDVRYGYDSVLLVFEQPVTTRLDRVRNGFQVQVTAVRFKSSETDQLQTQLLRSRYLVRIGREQAARNLLIDLAEDHPKNADVFTTLAEVNRQVGRWIGAINDYQRALERRPESDLIRRAYHDLLDARRPFLRTRFDYQTVGEDVRRVIQASEARDYLGERYELKLRLRTTRARIADLLRQDGTSGEFDGVRRQATIELSRHRVGADVASALVFASRAGPGLGGRYELVGPDRRTSFKATLLEPAWSFREGLAQAGTLDRLRLGHRELLGEFELTAGAGVRNYRLERETQARAVALFGSATYNLWPTKPSVAAAYRVSGLYPLSAETRSPSGGRSFKPLPVANREVHTLRLTGAYRFQDGYELRAGGGYMTDRFGGAGPLGSVTAIIPIGRNWRVRAGWFRSVNLPRTDLAVTRARLSLRWRYAATPAGGLRRLWK